ncbi:hypothetical protein QBC34DRAFT_411435 [Podospora aff. communis PSN243]|uniref:Alcohol dehydrogenase n=1 Tax=Podospora aff. communis PSN243 TaxID=3040156 RepID=A0AAV9GCI6_9PEZI|nr:hypothetical protein QBC34DRAFT_411435 [Podospora aff. communis PSN243]
MAASAPAIPATMKAIVKESPLGGVSLKTVPTPEVHPGSVICESLAFYFSTGDVKRLTPSDTPSIFTHPTPFVPGGYQIARVAAVGPDATTLKTGQLVLVECWVRGRDNTDAQILWGMFDGVTPASKKLAADYWRDGGLSEYFRSPLENTWALDESRLCGSPSDGGLGYSISELVAVPVFCVAYGGFRTVDLKAGETVVVSPATGHFSMSAVAIADAIGAKVIAVSRNADRLKQLRDIFPRVKTVVPTGDVAADTQAIVAAAGGYVDVFADVSPAAAVGSRHLESCIGAVKQYGRVCLMGGRGDPTLPVGYLTMVIKSLTIRGSFMYEREHVKGLIKLVESGRLPIGKAGGFPVVSEIPVSRYEEAFAEAEKDFGIEGMVTVVRG